MSIEDVKRDTAKQVAEEEARLRAKNTAQQESQTKEDKKTASKKEQEYQKIIKQLAAGGIPKDKEAALTTRAAKLADDIATLKAGRRTEAGPTTSPYGTAAEAVTKKTTTATPSKVTAPELASTQELVPNISSVSDQALRSSLATTTPAGMGAVGRGEYTPSATQIAATADKTSTAIAKAIELYQMPDIIFSNVPELRAILDRYLDPKTPISLDQFVKEVGNSLWYRQNSKTIQNRQLQQFNYNDLKSKGQLTGNTQYEQDIKRITQTVIAKARELGSPVDPTNAELIAQDLYSHNMETDMAALTKRLAGGIRTQALGTTGQTGYLGAAESNYQKLLQLAKDNGLDLKTILPARVSGANDQEITNNVLAGLADGSLDISAIEQTARTLAAQGQPQYVKDLLAQGYDLAQVYAPYKKIMSSVLELSPDQINLNDPTLRGAISNTGEMNTYDFQRALRKDPRWQYTANAAQDVSNAALGVLRDFGFQG